MKHRTRFSAFTLVELMIAAGLFGLVAGGAIGLYLVCQRYWFATTLDMKVTRDASLALNRLVYGVGTNHGLRAAAAVTLLTNMYGYRDGDAAGYPLAADSDAHEVLPATGGNDPDGSWRLVVSNFNGISWIDYNRNASNIVYWENTAAADSRLLIGNHVADAEVVTNTRGLAINLTGWNRRGELTGSNTVGTFIKLRNQEQ